MAREPEGGSEREPTKWPDRYHVRLDREPGPPGPSLPYGAEFHDEWWGEPERRDGKMVIRAWCVCGWAEDVDVTGLEPSEARARMEEVMDAHEMPFWKRYLQRWRNRRGSGA